MKSVPAIGKCSWPQWRKLNAYNNANERGYFRITEKQKETTVYISGTRKETTFLKKEDIFGNGNGNGNEKSFSLSLPERVPWIHLFLEKSTKKIVVFLFILRCFSWFLTWNHWERFKMNKKSWKRLKIKAFLPAFGCAQHPKAGLNTQHLTGTSYIHINILCWRL